ncbi:MAG: hypothetical protein ABL982_12390 [Vicinamibacterales bacterium]
MTERELDLTRIVALGDPATEEGRAALVEIFLVYFDNVSATVAAMRLSASSEEVKAHAHRAKGASGVVGASGLMASFDDIEACAAAGERVTADTYDHVERQLASLRRTVSARLAVALP